MLTETHEKQMETRQPPSAELLIVTVENWATCHVEFYKYERAQYLPIHS